MDYHCTLLVLAGAKHLDPEAGLEDDGGGDEKAHKSEHDYGGALHTPCEG
ncbi:hypothetical protein GCM10022627_25200 [Haloarcula argentinensis]|uniref:Uncharacterized protein n=1 Tax=Haloarcula argentinensis TaxID=43776 RepID=A0A830FVM8_HALAR|nr:hypothetical protein GCM10009006_21550 [Haloarcula argentinensis]